MTKRMLIMLGAVGLVFGGILVFQLLVKPAMMRKFIPVGVIPPQTVSTAKAGFSEWQGEFQAVGTLRAVRGADIAPEVAGVITAIHFQSGHEIEAGAPLVQLNAESDLARLQSLAAAAELAEVNYQRDQKQLEIQAGSRAVDIGQYVTAGTKLVTLQALDPVYVDFYAPQKSLGKIALKQRMVLQTDAFAGEQFPGEISSIDPKVDPATRNVQVRATVRNPKRSLLPGMFATVSIATGGPQRFITLPQTSVSYNPYGDTVFVVEEQKGQDGKALLLAQQKFVTIGGTRGDQVAILSGIKEGDTVVTAGQIKLRTGVPVIVNNSIQPANDPAPQPKDP